MSALRQRARALLDATAGRGALKRLAAELDQEEDLRLALIVEARGRGVELPEDAARWPAKRLLRRARGRDVEARVKTTPTARDEGFTCVHCGAVIEPHGRTARDHCPRCLRSVHVDVVPGDRAAGCGGVLEPVGAEQGGGGAWKIRYRCRVCGAERSNQAILDGDDPDDWIAITRLAATSGS